ncbi:phosphoserine phosphatase SerB [Microbaculum marinum]|uniref:Phosphoserine phosphatase n=1 Tax=Microbaculum marinum TaxID=1764581 RepID=A0AAW9S3F4_9HYPH
MNHVVVLIADSKSGLAPEVVETVRTATGGGEERWLRNGVACDIPLQSPVAEPKSLAADIRAGLSGMAVDVAILPADNRRKSLLIADMDSTIIGQECIDELADMVGLKAHVAAITERAMRGEIAFEPALRERVALLKGIDLETIRRLIDERITLNPGAETLIRTMRAHGAHTALVSGGFSLFTSRIAALVGFDENRANELLLEGDRLVGLVREPILGRDAKREALLELTAAAGISKDAAIAVGDGANDLAMLQEAGLGVAYHAKPAVADAADIRIDHGDLTALLYVQGYRNADFVS